MCVRACFIDQRSVTYLISVHLHRAAILANFFSLFSFLVMTPTFFSQMLLFCGSVLFDVASFSSLFSLFSVLLYSAIFWTLLWIHVC